MAKVKQEQVEQEKKAAPADPGVAGGDVPAPPQGAVPGGSGAVPSAETRDAAIAASQRIRIDTPSLSGSINLTGARIDDVRLKRYHVTVDDASPTIELLNPSGLPNGYFAEIGFVGNAATGAVPSADTIWTVEGNQTLAPATPVTLAFTNEKGLTFKRTFSVDANYMFTVSDTVTMGCGYRLAVELRPRHALQQADHRLDLRTA